MSNLYCPDCGCKALRLIENTDPNGDEYKEVRTCDLCPRNFVYIVRKFKTRFAKLEASAKALGMQLERLSRGYELLLEGSVTPCKNLDAVEDQLRFVDYLP